MSNWLKQSTAVDIGLGPFLDEADGITPLTDLTLSQADIRLKKNNGSWAQKNDSNAATHEENGWYEISLDTTDTGTLGSLIIAVHESGALPVWKEYMVVPANVYDSLIGGSDNLQVDTVQAAGTAWASGAITAAAFAADAITAAKLASDVSTEIASGVWGAGTRTLTALDEDNTTLDIDSAVRGAVGLSSADLDTQLAGIVDDTEDIQDRLPAALISGRLDTTVGAMQSGVLTATAIAADAITAAKLASDVGTEIASSVWGAGTRTLTALDEDDTTLDLDGTIRAAVGLSSANLDTQLDSLATPADVNAQVLDVLTVDEFSQPGQEAPPASQTLAKILTYLYKFMRNKITTTHDSYKVYADDGSTVDHQATLSEDAGEFTRGEIDTGAED